MVHESGLGWEFFAALTAWDEQIAAEVAAGGCPRCGGPLHRADYARKPRGALQAAAAEAFTLRHSLCCGREGCRARALPPSLRFLGRRVYVEAVVLLASVVAQLARVPCEARAATGVPARTLRRWGTWWRETFPRMPTWIALRATFAPPPPDETDLPKALLDRFAADHDDRAGRPKLAAMCELAARCLAPATTESVPDGSRFVRSIFARLAPG
jgi:hypothetical protein